jgi:hypothetical protein
MNDNAQPRSVAAGLRYAATHSAITLLAIGIAFALPEAARYILYNWWPQVEADSQLLLATEILLAAVLVLLFNLAMVSWDNRRFVVNAKLAALVHARGGGGWLARLRERHLLRRLPPSRDAFVLSVTGHHTFVDERSFAASALRTAYELRVMLLRPDSEGARQRAGALPPGKGLAALRGEVEATIARLEALRQAGKRVTLKFYDEPPLWKIVVLGERVWVQFCHDGHELRHAPEYVFALDAREPTRGLFVPFYMMFMRKWSEPQHPEYDFDRRELVYRDAAGNEVRRDPFLSRGDETPRIARASEAA